MDTDLNADELTDEQFYLLHSAVPDSTSPYECDRRAARGRAIHLQKQAAIPKPSPVSRDASSAPLSASALWKSVWDGEAARCAKRSETAFSSPAAEAVWQSCLFDSAQRSKANEPKGKGELRDAQGQRLFM